MNIGNKLKELRERKSLSLKDVCQSTGLTSSYLKQLESNHIQRISAEKAQTLSEFFNISIDELLGNEVKKKDNPLSHLPDKDKKEIINIIKKGLF